MLHKKLLRQWASTQPFDFIMAFVPMVERMAAESVIAKLNWQDETGDFLKITFKIEAGLKTVWFARVHNEFRYTEFEQKVIEATTRQVLSAALLEMQECGINLGRLADHADG